MARDYKNTAAKSKAKTKRPGSWLSFISGLAIGLVVAVGVFVLRSGPLDDGVEVQAGSSIEETGTLSGAKFEEAVRRSLPKREFDFYKILPEIEVKVPDWEIAEPSEENASEFKQGTYVLQVGSFKQHADADRAKAKLALLGIQAKIHRVVINGQDVWYRVHVGPYSDMASIQAMRGKLISSGNDFILLKIGEGAG